ncbi:hypothetical protein FOZ63_018349, partial [Perkinsus olseni]
CRACARYRSPDEMAMITLHSSHVLSHLLVQESPGRRLSYFAKRAHDINLSYIWVLCPLDYMVENSLADPAENLRPAVVEVCALLGVKDSTLLRFLPDAEI